MEELESVSWGPAHRYRPQGLSSGGGVQPPNLSEFSHVLPPLSYPYQLKQIRYIACEKVNTPDRIVHINYSNRFQFTKGTPSFLTSLVEALVQTLFKLTLHEVTPTILRIVNSL